MDGFNASVLRDESLEIPEVDIVATHHYPGNKKSFAELIRANADKAKGKKPYVVGEFGFVSTAQMADAMQAIKDSSASGGLLWSLRFRDRDGGFYWHSEPGLGRQSLQGLSLAGFITIGNDYDEEINLMAMVRSNAFAIRGLPVPPVAGSRAPKIAADCRCRRDFVARFGRRDQLSESSAQRNWQLVTGKSLPPMWTRRSPSIVRSSRMKTCRRANWFYRVRAQNESGISEPSNVIGPVTGHKSATLVDELADFSKTHLQQRRLEACRS